MGQEMIQLKRFYLGDVQMIHVVNQDGAVLGVIRRRKGNTKPYRGRFLSCPRHLPAKGWTMETYHLKAAIKWAASA